MTLNQIKELLKQKGIWRCKIVESRDMTKIGMFELHVPRTSKARARDLISNYIPIGFRVEIKEIKNPLKYKKYTYLHVCTK